MTLFDKPKRPAAWEPDPLLATVQSQPHFLRVNWNEKQATDFGPWRLAPLGEPLDAVEVPQDDVDVDLSLPTDTQDQTHEMASGETVDELESVPVDQETAPAEPQVEALVHSPDELDRLTQVAHAQGWAEGHAQAQADALAQFTEKLTLLTDLANGLHGLNHEPQRFFEPLKRLALHMAEQLVRGELQVSGQAVANLVKQALETLGETREKVILHLNPMDADVISESAPEVVAQCVIETDGQLQRGSVRVSVNDAVVEDLIEHRLEALARRILVQPEAWLQHSTLMHPTSSPVATPRWATTTSKKTITEIQDVEDISDTTDMSAGNNTEDNT